MVREGISPTPNSIISAKAPDHVTTMMYERALVHYPIAETNSTGRFYLHAAALQSYEVSPLLFVSDKSKYGCTGT